MSDITKKYIDICSYCSLKNGRRTSTIECVPVVARYCQCEECKTPTKPLCNKQVREVMNVLLELSEESVELAMFWCSACIATAMNQQLAKRPSYTVYPTEDLHNIRREYFDKLPQNRFRKEVPEEITQKTQEVVDLTQEDEEEEPTIEPNYEEPQEILVSTPDVDHQVLGIPVFVEEEEEERPRKRARSEIYEFETERRMRSGRVVLGKIRRIL